MNIGRFKIEQLSEGFFELFEDGTFNKMDPSRLNQPGEDPSLGRYSSALGIDPLLISDGDLHIVVDPGLGWGLDYNSRYKSTSNIQTNLEIFGLKPGDIQFVILSHLHYDHCAGCTSVSDQIKTTSTFPNARIIVQQEEWDFALAEQQENQQTPGADYRLDELYRLKADDRFQFINDEFFTLTKGIDTIKSGGHTPGHQIIKIHDAGNTAYFLGDLIPTEYHLNHYAMKVIDNDPLKAKKSKTLLLNDAYREKAQLYFYHSLYNKTGKLSKDRHRNYVLKNQKK